LPACYDATGRVACSNSDWMREARHTDGAVRTENVGE
jgi:hypothetical protein